MVRKALVKGEMDRRIIEQKIRSREIGEDELKKALAPLPDVEEKAEFVKIGPDEKRKPGGSTSHAD
jgi:hypothetical protein